MVKRVLYRDGLMLVLDKPAGLPVHPGPGGGLTVEDYLDALRFGLRSRPHLAHRLDRDTSGCLVLGRHRKALRRLNALFRQGRVEKTYWAIVHGRPPQDAGVIDLPLSKVSRDPRSWWMRPDPAGQPARTEYRVLAGDDALSWVELRPRTGRTHQLRVHMAALGCPIVGDPVYGPPEDRGTPMMLHARAIEIPLYPNRLSVRVEAPLPEHMRAPIERLREAAAAAGRSIPPVDATMDRGCEPVQPAAEPHGREEG